MAEENNHIPSEPRRMLSHLIQDPDVWASIILSIGSVSSKALSAAEHIEFLISIREEKFRVIFDFWESVGWWLSGGIGALWLIYRFQRRHSPAGHAPTWGMVVSCSVVAFVFGSLLAVSSSGGIPKVIVSWGGPPCHALVDTSHLMSFRDSYKLGLVCIVPDPSSDPLTDNHFLVSNPFEIVPGGVRIVADYSPSGFDLSKVPPGPVNLGFLAVLIPRDMPKEKITSLADLMRSGGKILDPKYYR